MAAPADQRVEPSPGTAGARGESGGEADSSTRSDALLSWRPLTVDGEPDDSLYTLLADGQLVASLGEDTEPRVLYRLEHGHLGEPDTIMEAIRVFLREFSSAVARGAYQVQIVNFSKRACSLIEPDERAAVERLEWFTDRERD